MNALLDDRRVRLEEYKALQERDTERIKALDEQLHATQCLLYDSTKDYLDLKYSARAKERDHIAEKEHLIKQLDPVKDQFDLSGGTEAVLGVNVSREPTVHRRLIHVSSAPQLQMQLEQTQQLADNYREQCILMEEKLAKMKEEKETSEILFKERTDRLTKRLRVLNSRYEILDKRRGLEIEGYKNDIKLLRQRLKEVEKQLYKVNICYIQV